MVTEPAEKRSRSIVPRHGPIQIREDLTNRECVDQRILPLVRINRPFAVARSLRLSDLYLINSPAATSRSSLHRQSFVYCHHATLLPVLVKIHIWLEVPVLLTFLLLRIQSSPEGIMPPARGRGRSRGSRKLESRSTDLSARPSLEELRIIYTPEKPFKISCRGKTCPIIEMTFLIYPAG